MSSKDRLPDKGYRYAILTELFREKRKSGGFVSKQRFKKAMAEEKGDAVLPTDGCFWVEIAGLRAALREVSEEYEIKTRAGYGYKVIKNEIILDGISLASVMPGPLAVNVVT